MTKRKWREELKRRAIEAQRSREIKELERRRLVGIKSIPAIGHGPRSIQEPGNTPAAGTMRTVFFVGPKEVIRAGRAKP